jgi:hypothetical protein
VSLLGSAGFEIPFLANTFYVGVSLHGHWLGEIGHCAEARDFPFLSYWPLSQT